MAVFRSKDAAEPSSSKHAVRKTSRSTAAYFRLLLSKGHTPFDLLLLAGGIIGAIATGIPFPLLGIIFGQLINNLNSTTCAENAGTSTADLSSGVRTRVLDIIYVTIANWCFIYLHTTCWGFFGERLVRRLRERYLRSLLRQETAFFDEQPAGDVSSRLSVDLEAIQTGVSEKVGIVIGTVSYFVASYVVAFLKDAVLAGILVSLVPAYLLMVFLGSYFTKRYAARVSDHIASATSIASESLKKLTLVHAFGAGPRLEEKFADYLGQARKETLKKNVSSAAQLGLLFFISYSTNALAYWQGSRSIADSVGTDRGNSQVGAVYTVIFVLIDASFILAQVAPFMTIFGTAAAAHDKLNKAIERSSKIDGLDRDHGARPTPIHGDIRFENVSFNYPGRPDTAVLQDLGIDIPALKHTAIVGQSGSGKSTVAALLGRLYDPTRGAIRIDGADIRELNVRHLRSFIGIVQQDPSLLDRTILENIAHGLVNSSEADLGEQNVVLDGGLAEFAKTVREGTGFEDALKSQSPALRTVVARVVQAATAADVIGFIDRLEHGLATSVGSAGNQLSGGQKQRIALSRALVRNPKILVLDEATSSLDSQSERAIQSALQKATKGRTTVSIAHRLSSIKDADNIIVMRSGKVIEQGTHQELVKKDDVYASMVRLQEIGSGVASADELGTSSSGSSKNISPSVEDEKSGKEPLVINEKERETDLSASDKPALQNDGAGDADTGASRPDDEEHSKKRGVWSTICGIGILTRPQALFLLVAFTASAIVGGSYSGEAVIFGHTISSLSACNSPTSIRHYGSFWGLIFFVLALIEFCANFMMSSVFGFVSENTLYKVRVLVYRTLVGQNIQWHESKGRTPSELLSFLTTDSNALAGLTGTVLGTLFSIIISTVAGITLSLVIAWRISVVLLGCIPVLLGAGIMRLRVVAKFHEKHAKAFSSATGYAVEAVSSIRTIASFSLEEEAVNVYHRALKAPYAETLKAILWSNVWLATAYSISNLVYALAYWWGSRNIAEGWYSQTQFFIVLPALLFSAQTCGQLFALAPDFSKSRVSAARILNLLDLGREAMTVTPKDLKTVSPFHGRTAQAQLKDIENEADTSPEKRIHLSGEVRGSSASFRSVEFSYPARPDAKVLRGLDLEIKPGQFCALVGPSGAGKSTIMALLERFYRPSAGQILLDGRDISKLDGVDFRDEIAIVPQESVLFEGTLRFNLGLGARPGQSVTQEEIERACQLAHIHEAIMALPQGYETKCGPDGNQFSGGQKQRLSIARALLRNPRLLLLDESTSALDAESEKLVQDALENVRKGITVIAIAHRLRTIQNADCIFVIEDGRCQARGTHAELLVESETYRTNALHQVLGD